jgi:hypothetical protein
MSRGRRTGPPPTYLRLVVSADQPSGDAASEGLPAGWGAWAVERLMSNMVATANQITDRAVDALRGEVTTFGLDFDPDTLEAIRKATFVTISTGIYARMERGFHGSDDDPLDEDGVAGDPEDDLHPYVEHTGVGLRERLRLILETGDEPA